MTPPRELRKFQDLHILDATCGRHHILIFAALKTTIFTSLDLSDPNDNNYIEEAPIKRIVNSPQQLVALPTPEPSPPPKHVLTKQTVIDKIPVLEKRPAEVQLSNETDPNSGSKASTETVIDVSERKEDSISNLTETDSHLTTIEAVPSAEPVTNNHSLSPPANQSETTPSLNEFEELEMQSALSAVGDVGKMVETGVKSEVDKMITGGMKQVDQMKESASEAIKEAHKDAVNAINTEIVQPVGEKIGELNDKKNALLNDVAEGVKDKTDSVIHVLESKFHLGDSKDDKDDADEDKVLFKKNDMFKNDMTKDVEAQIQTHMADANGHGKSAMDDDKMDSTSMAAMQNDNVTFINDGIDVTDDVTKSMKAELDEMNKGEEMVTEMHTKNEDSLLGEKLVGVKPVAANLLDSRESK